MQKDKLSKHYPRNLPSWKKLTKNYRSNKKLKSIKSLFTTDHNRSKKLSIEVGDLFLDYSKNFIDTDTVDLFSQLASEANLSDAIERMFSGSHVNTTEDKSALHVALRSKISDKIALNQDGVSQIWPTLDAMERFVSDLHEGKIRGSTNKKITNILNIGIGGSELGSTMTVNALRSYWKGNLNYYSVSNGDQSEINCVLKKIKLDETLFLICSKSFNTIETKNNATIAKEALEANYGKRAINKHFLAVSSNREGMADFGIHKDKQFYISDWVGGRFSITSAMGLPLACMIGMDNFYRFLDGARLMDMHFKNASFDLNMPVILAMLSIYYANFYNVQSQAIICYGDKLTHFTDYVRQLHMESLGKKTKIDGSPVNVNTGNVIWGGSGSDGQHSYYQLLHQGSYTIPIDFIVDAGVSDDQMDTYSLANCLAQSESLMTGMQEADPERSIDGDKPNNVIFVNKLSPQSIGQLVALYEHKVFVQSIIYGINAFDQYGVELGKKIAQSLSKVISKSSRYTGKNPSTRALLSKIREYKKG